MKIKNKETKFKSALGIFILSLVTLFSIIMVKSYDYIYKQADSIEKNVKEDYSYIQSELYRTSFTLNKLLKEKEVNKEISYNEVYKIKPFEDKEGYYGENIIYFDNLINIERRLEENRTNLEYYAKNTLTNKEITNSKNNLKTLLKSEDTSLLENYRYYITINYNENGEGKIISRSKESYNEDVFYKFKEVVFNNEGTSENLKNIEIVYAIPNELSYNADPIYYNEINDKTDDIGFMAIKYIVLFGGIMFLLGIFISYKKVNDDNILKKFLNWPFEILVTLFSLGGASMILVPRIINYSVNNRELLGSVYMLGISENTLNYIIVIGNVIYWFLIFIGIFGLVEVFKYTFGKGLFEYIKENTIVGRIIVYLFRKIKVAIEAINTIDLKKDGDKYLLKIVAINFVIVSIFCVLFSEISGALIYSMVLFFVLRKYINELKGKYEILLDATNKIAEGNLDVEIEEDLKIFNSVKIELKKIQKGFKRAVEEEVKSQNMKTELITNVSHDLKTPLTSIITYVDLLKQENITEEERRSYIETIDKKSKRLKTLIEDLFEVSKAGSRDVKLEIVNLDIVELIKQVEIEFSENLEAKRLLIKWINGDEKVILPLDSQKTFRIFENLIGNISKYSMENSRVYIEVLNNEDFATITLKNISETEINYTKEEIIERFNRGDKSRNTEGSGLGLAIAKNFTEIQNGEFNINLDGDLFKVEIRFNKEKTYEVIEEINNINKVDIRSNNYIDADYIEKDKYNDN